LEQQRLGNVDQIAHCSAREAIYKIFASQTCLLLFSRLTISRI